MVRLCCHGMRHIFACLMSLRRAILKVISEATGHSSVAFTMATYSHIIEAMQEDAMALLKKVSLTVVSRKNNAILTPIIDIMISYIYLASEWVSEWSMLTVLKLAIRKEINCDEKSIFLCEM